jgi:Skp family chaperone for outer membrane proteins
MKKLGTIALITWMVVISAWIITDVMNGSKKVAYIDMKQVFDSFQMKIELEKDFQSKSSSLQKEIEEGAMLFAAMQKRYEVSANPQLVDSLSYMGQVLGEKQKQLEEEFGALKTQYDAQIQTQLYQYLQEYGSDSGLDVVLTTLDGSTLIYAKETLNVTEEAIAFVNEKYEGLK